MLTSENDASASDLIAESNRKDPVGGAFEHRGQLFIRVTIAPRTRTAERAPLATSLVEAQGRGKVVQTWVNRLRSAGMNDLVANFIKEGAKADVATLAKIASRVDDLVGGDGAYAPVKDKPKTDRITFRTFAERWTSGDLARAYPDHIEPKASVSDDIERFEKHIYPHVEDVPLTSFSRQHADRVMTKLPPELKRGTRRQVAQLVSRVLHLAVFTGDVANHPLPRGWLPKAPKSASVAKESLLPSEEAKLLAGRDASGRTVVPLEHRVAYAFLGREGMRKGEIEGLTRADIDLKKRMVSLDENKTDRPRSWVLDVGVVQMLEQWFELQRRDSTDRVFPTIAWDKLAPAFRAHCEAVGIDRARLFERKANKLRLRAHDMRAFFVTAAMYAGKDMLWITDRTGHTSLGMLRTYERDVRRWRELGEAPVDVALAIPEIAAALAKREVAPVPSSSAAPKHEVAAALAAAHAAATRARTVPLPAVTIEKCTGRESNPYALRRRNLNPLRLPVSPPVR
jgi:integrase